MTADLTPQPGRAIDDPATRRGLNRLLRVAGLQALVGVGLFLVFAAVLSLLGGDPQGGVATLVVSIPAGLSGLLLVFALLTVMNNVRMRLLLRRYSWQVRPGKFGEVDVGPINGQPVLVLGGTASPNGTRSIVTMVTRWGLLAGHDTIWYAGRDDRSGVASPPGGENPMWARRMLIRLLRNSFQRSVTTGKHLVP